MICKECGLDFPRPKKWGFANMCKNCDVRVYEAKHVGVMIADGKTDYGFQLVRNPTESQAEKIKSLGLAHDPRTQMRFTSKGQYNEKSSKE